MSAPYEAERRPWREGAGPGAPSWLALDDDELLARIQAVPADHALDAELLAVVASDRHFFLRQEAAKQLRDASLLKQHASDRHVAQIMVRSMTRAEDRAYLERLSATSRHLEVRKAAEAQLRRLCAAVEGESPPARP